MPEAAYHGSQQLFAEVEDSVPKDMPPLEVTGHLADRDVPPEGVVYETEGDTIKALRKFGPEHGDNVIRCNRQKLREWFLTNVNIHWGKHFSHYEGGAEGEGVVVTFRDGSSYHGDILVAGDGTHSKVRNQLLPDPTFRPQPIPRGVIVGGLTATREQYMRWMKYGKSYYTLADPNIRLTVSMKWISEDQESAEYVWLYGWADKGAIHEKFWTSTASREELSQYVLSNLNGFSAELFASSLEDARHASSTNPTRQSDVDGRFESSDDFMQAFSVGDDSTYADSEIVRGQGGNMAMLDGLRLATVISRSAGAPIEDVLKEYEIEMNERGTKAVLASRAAIPTGDPSWTATKSGQVWQNPKERKNIAGEQVPTG
ncbi:uncharacterized protein LTR77_006447 [Saxophila tyrrhenica]|uniref:FAD-binding domain-containing protein n=1 Tax=Saxophila tyrrhenica TaxID=1690608 RepID=A0AAV9P8E1_9PEZI|nr:hypothetical protein LTR77_006447 [Saxophila tyrrhenica]